jgi:hypothetical protein
LLLLFASGAVQLPSSTLAAGQPEVLSGYLRRFKCQYDEKRTHSRQCALRPECMVTGYGIALEDGMFVQFDADGNKKAVRLLKDSKQTDNLRAVAKGTRVGPLFRLTSLRLE